MKIYDISMEITHDMMVYKNREEKRPHLKTSRDFTTGSVYESIITMDLHTGTHMDAPLHMMQGGDTIDRQDLSKTIVKCKVLDVTKAQKSVSKKHLENKDIQKGDFILLKTRNSFEDVFNVEFIYLDKEGAQYLKEKEVIGVGIDALGIERAQSNHDTHHTLMKADILIIEGLVLKDVEEGEYTLIALPLKIKGGEASPVRAVLIQGNL
ncbi:cyclase family protein [Irregularibacter muris]|jgi:arylformamidase|uniref:Kynurenine formamidase n=1 Tax=Irregularibacter muris TaxID=1796619 RepID=A0AAE3HIX2_9FIRM|nr:cyclase family protein [Irregularibacter muris]MCR1899513.1 cyclase family protein [Irregularibacter muris]